MHNQPQILPSLGIFPAAVSWFLLACKNDTGRQLRQTSALTCAQLEAVIFTIFALKSSGTLD